VAGRHSQEQPHQAGEAPGLTVGIIPSRPGTIVVPQWNPQLEMWVVEVPYDNAFMELFSCSWRPVTEFLKADAKVPKVRDLPDSEDRRSAAILAGLRRLTVLDAVGVLAGQAQADLVEVSSATVTAIVMGVRTMTPSLTGFPASPHFPGRSRLGRSRSSPPVSPPRGYPVRTAVRPRGAGHDAKCGLLAKDEADHRTASWLSVL
jgi:hypothetical protein